MSIFTRYAMDALMKNSHPDIDRKQCWNMRPSKERCSDCMDICPKGEDVFKRPNLVKSWDACSDCGLCVGVCRTRCIAPSEEQITRDIAPIDSASDTIWIGCDRSTRRNDIVRDCICALSWETVAYLALNKKLVLDLTPCGECENDLCAEKLRQMLTRLVEFFGERVFEALFTLAYQPEDAPYQQKNISRREMFNQMTDKSKAGTKQLLKMIPGLQDKERGRSLDFRLLLNQRMKQLKVSMETPLRYGFYLPNVSDKCYACGKCVTGCRAGALRLEKSEDGNATRLIITPWKCSECGQCVKACTDRFMDGMTLRQITTLGPVSLRKIEEVHCADCGKPIKPDSLQGLCVTCRVKANSKRRQEEAAAKAKQRLAEREAEAKAKQQQEQEAAAKAAQVLAEQNPLHTAQPTEITPASISEAT